jgi:2-keto-4-pentenoate hydratase/2-oxohepta-3-ene-1,7-dioic acid hydratase in catechol pathway
MKTIETPPAGRVWVVLGGFRAPDDAPPGAGVVPRLIAKATRSVSGDGGSIACPAGLGEVMAEGELALVIGREIHRPTVEAAAAAILGFTCFNDVTAGELLAAREFSLSKSIDTFASMGPWVRTDLPDEDVSAGLAIITRVNGVVRQEGNTGLYKFPPAEVVRYLAAHLTLLPGDVISLGTPPPAPPIAPGDEVEIEVEGIGVLHNTVVEG